MNEADPLSMIAEATRFHADRVKGFEESYTPEYVVHGIYFGDGEVGEGGQHWSFSRASRDDDGVCTVKEWQAVTLYGGIQAFSLTRRRLECEFDEKGAHASSTRRLVIDYAIDDQTWAGLVQQANRVFEGEPYAAIEEA